MLDQKTVFVVDDDAAAAASLEALMMSIGLPVETFASAEAFLEAVKPGRRGCLVLDVRLGGMDGFELQRRLGQSGHDLPIIVVSGHADRELSEKALENGAVACFEKPFLGGDLCGTIRSVLSGSDTAG